MTVMTKPQQSVRLEPVHPKPEEAHTMPYAPAVRIVGACDLMFLSGATPSPLYHKHPHVDAEHVHPHSIEEQTTRAMEAIKSILDEVGAGWRDVVKVTKYLTDFRDADAMHATMGQIFWRLASGEHNGVHQSTVVTGGTYRTRYDRGAAQEARLKFSVTTSERASCTIGQSWLLYLLIWRALLRPSIRASQRQR